MIRVIIPVCVGGRSSKGGYRMVLVLYLFHALRFYRPLTHCSHIDSSVLRRPRGVIGLRLESDNKLGSWATVKGWALRWWMWVVNILLLNRINCCLL